MSEMVETVREPAPSPNGKVPVRMLKDFHAGNAWKGDVVGFPPDDATQLVKQGAAQYVKPVEAKK